MIEKIERDRDSKILRWQWSANGKLNWGIGFLLHFLLFLF